MTERTNYTANDVTNFDFKEIHDTTEKSNSSDEKHVNNESYKEERAKRIRRSISSKYNSDNSITVTMRNGYNDVIGEETFTKDDLFLLAQEKGEKIIDKKNKDKRRTDRNKGIDDTLEEVCKMIGLSVLSIAGCKLLDVTGKKSAKLVKSLARKIAK